MLDKIIASTDAKLNVEELELIQKINETYNKAVMEAQKELSQLLKIEGTLSSKQVREVLDKTMTAFSKEMEKLAKPIAEAMQRSYNLGLSETGQILEHTEER